MVADDNFEVLTSTEVDAATAVDREPPEEKSATPPPNRVRKLCACGCGEEVTGNRALKRGHTMGDGLPASIFSANDIAAIQAGFVLLIGHMTAGVERKWGIPKTEPEESQALGEPIGRIFSRHIPRELLKKMKPGDMADCTVIGTTLVAYMTRIATAPKQAEVIPVATNGHNNDQTVSGLGQYSYRPPEQTFQSQNDSAN